MSLQGPKPASQPCIPLVRFFSPEAAQECDENHLRAFRELHEGAGGGESQETLYVSPLSLIRAPLTALQMEPRRPKSPLTGGSSENMDSVEAQTPALPTAHPGLCSVFTSTGSSPHLSALVRATHGIVPRG